jgi:branched-chain amino acid transport system permease protein
MRGQSPRSNGAQSRAAPGRRRASVAVARHSRPDVVNTSLLFTQILNGMATGMLYALMGIGLAIITGVLNIPNFAHGAMFAVGAYLLFTVLKVVGDFWVALVLAPLGVVLLGLLVEYAGIRPLYRAGHDYQLLLTFGLSLILTEGIIVIWGPIGMSQLPPPILRGGVDLGLTIYPKYRLFVMVMAGLLVLGAWLFFEKTRYGAIMRAGIEDKEMVSLLGIDIHRLFTAAFGLGAYLAGIAGALTAPIRGLNPFMGVDMLGIAFVVVALGGLGNLPGAIVAGLMIGVAQSLVALVWTEASVAVIFAVMALVLLVRPQGLFGIR